MSIQLFYSNWQNLHLAPKKTFKHALSLAKPALDTHSTPLLSEILSHSDRSFPSQKPIELEKTAQIPHAFPSIILTWDANVVSFYSNPFLVRGCSHIF